MVAGVETLINFRDTKVDLGTQLPKKVKDRLKHRTPPLLTSRDAKSGVSINSHRTLPTLQCQRVVRSTFVGEVSNNSRISGVGNVQPSPKKPTTPLVAELLLLPCATDWVLLRPASIASTGTANHGSQLWGSKGWETYAEKHMPFFYLCRHGPSHG